MLDLDKAKKELDRIELALSRCARRLEKAKADNDEMALRAERHVINRLLDEWNYYTPIVMLADTTTERSLT